MSGYIRSGRNSPCPHCGRVKDSDCRWRPGEVILCHTGTDEPRGAVVIIDGAEWAVIRHDGGFSGQQQSSSHTIQRSQATAATCSNHCQ